MITHTQDVLGHMISRNVTGFTKSNLIHCKDTELVLCVIHKTRHHELCDLEILWNIAPHPVFRLCSLELHLIAQDLTSTIISWFCPRKANAAVCGVDNLRESRRSRGIYWRNYIQISDAFGALRLIIWSNQCITYTKDPVHMQNCMDHLVSQGLLC